MDDLSAFVREMNGTDLEDFSVTNVRRKRGAKVTKAKKFIDMARSYVLYVDYLDYIEGQFSFI